MTRHGICTCRPTLVSPRGFHFYRLPTPSQAFLKSAPAHSRIQRACPAAGKRGGKVQKAIRTVVRPSRRELPWRPGGSGPRRFSVVQWGSRWGRGAWGSRSMLCWRGLPGCLRGHPGPRATERAGHSRAWRRTYICARATLRTSDSTTPSSPSGDSFRERHPEIAFPEILVSEESRAARACGGA